MKTSILIVSVFTTLVLSGPTPQAGGLVPCDKINVHLFTEKNRLGLDTNPEVCKGACNNITGLFDNNVSSISPNAKPGVSCVLYDLADCKQGGAGNVTITRDENDLGRPGLSFDNKASSFSCTWF